MSEKLTPDLPSGLQTSFQWILLSGLSITVLTLAAVHAPSRLKVLGLFALGIALVGGWIVGRVANYVRCNRGKTFTIGSAVLIFCSLIGLAAESHRLYAKSIRKQYAAATKGHLKIKQFNNVGEGSKDQRQQLTDELSKDATRFAAYLKFRTGRRSPSGHLAGWPVPWPWVLFFGTIGGVIVAIRTRQTCDPVDGDLAAN